MVSAGFGIDFGFGVRKKHFSAVYRLRAIIMLNLSRDVHGGP
jgi:hypothetical protein